MLLAEVARTSAGIARAPARSAKLAALADLFAAAPDAELPLVVSWLAGRLPQGRPGIGWRALSVQTPPAAGPALTVREVDAAVTAWAEAAGPGVRARRAGILAELLGAATEEEQRFLRALLSGEVRQGALDALALEALARSADAPVAAVRRAVMLAGSLPEVAGALRAEGPAILDGYVLTAGRPVRPMLAGSARTVAEAADGLGPCALEEKLDGIRVQAHRSGETVRIWSRALEELTGRLPEVVEAVRGLDCASCVLDGEVIAVGPDGHPVSFQRVASRVGTRSDPDAARAALPLTPFFFDLLALDGRPLADAPTVVRHAALARLVPAEHLVRRHVLLDPRDPAALRAAEDFRDETLARGHEGVVLKALDAPYEAGRRGARWIKVKPVHTLDLVVLAAEWGHGRRTGTLSNLHLGARGADGGFVMLGKTFKGLTDAMLREQTLRLGELALSDDGFTVRVRPEFVVEIAYDGLQRSPRYPAGVALRFARVLRHRPDKNAAEADTVETVLARDPRVTEEPTP
ncbi:ATP-dependent DNA ligase [Streptomyces sp. BI20]|uniref:ATP-dependent DNA ligase n=1 Tax=Streptomyces sp. BI20 TaxID=3403460 RepID=UPI003C7722CC